jgi:hypothetical protein
MDLLGNGIWCFDSGMIVLVPHLVVIYGSSNFWVMAKEWQNEPFRACRLLRQPPQL